MNVNVRTYTECACFSTHINIEATQRHKHSLVFSKQRIVGIMWEGSMYRQHYFGRTLWWMNGGITRPSDGWLWMTSIYMLCRERLSLLFGAGEGRAWSWMENWLESHKSIFTAHKRGKRLHELMYLCIIFVFVFLLMQDVGVCMQVWGGNSCVCCTHQSIELILLVERINWLILEYSTHADEKLWMGA